MKHNLFPDAWSGGEEVKQAFQTIGSVHHFGGIQRLPSNHGGAAWLTPSPAYGGIRWAASPMMVRLGSVGQC